MEDDSLYPPDDSPSGDPSEPGDPGNPTGWWEVIDGAVAWILFPRPLG